MFVLFAEPLETKGGCVYPVKLHGSMTIDGSAFSPGASLESVLSQIEAAESDSSAAAILLDVNSGGGSPSASKDLYEAIANANKPVVAYFNDAAASGAYYASAPADYIVSNPNALTGSLGARFTLLNYADLFEELGLSEYSIQSGELKDMGAGYRNLTAEEEALLQEIADELAANFHADVQAARGDKLTSYYQDALDARVLSASQALRAGLVDEVASRKRAIEKAAELSGGNAVLCDVPEEFSLGRLFSSMGSAFASGFKNGFAASAEYR